MPVGLRDLLDGARADRAPTRVGDQDLDRPELVFDGGAHGLDLGVVGEIGEHGHGSPADGLDLGAHGLGGVEVAAVHGDPCTLRGEENGDGRPNAAGAASDERDLVLKCSHRGVLSSRVI
jgi:hypothetical protein